VFGAGNTPSRKRDAVDHVLDKMNIIKQKQVDINDSLVIIKREFRRIVNIDDLKKAAMAVGFKNVQIVEFEKMSVKEQMTLAANCGTMVGVQGAGLQWAIFMLPGSTLIEISWKYWTSFYGFVTTYDIEHIDLVSKDVQVNWQALRVNGNEEKLKLLNIKPTGNWVPNNIWKQADVTVDIDEFTKQLRIVRNNCRNGNIHQ